MEIRWARCAVTTGRATCASWKTPSSVRLRWRLKKSYCRTARRTVEGPGSGRGVGLAGGPGSIASGSVLPEGVDMEKYVADIERSLLLAALAQSNGVQTRAADVLKISYRSFRHLVKKYGL